MKNEEKKMIKPSGNPFCRSAKLQRSPLTPTASGSNERTTKTTKEMYKEQQNITDVVSSIKENIAGKINSDNEGNNSSLKLENEELKSKLDKIEKLLTKLSNQVAVLESENKHLRNKLNNKEADNTQKSEKTTKDSQSKQNAIGKQLLPKTVKSNGTDRDTTLQKKFEFSTDEEELNCETDWILKKKPSKKRKAEKSPDMDAT